MRATSLVESAAPGQDSFLDIMTNMVGILIVLMMIGGMRVKNAPAAVASSESLDRARAGAASEAQREQAIYREISGIATNLGRVAQDIEVRGAERAGLSQLVAAWEQKVAQRRSQLDSAAGEQVDAMGRLREARQEVARLQGEIQSLRNQPRPTIEIRSELAPLSKPVDGNECHFQLHGGRVIWIPLEHLLERMRADAEQKLYRLRDQPEMTETVGPLGGFRLRYTLARRDMTEDEFVATRRGGAVISLVKWELIPTDIQMGETLEEALAPQSQFRSALGGFRPGRHTMTLWTYPDSFALYRRVREELRRQGFETAGRPLFEGILIGGSPEGSKSAAE